MARRGAKPTIAIDGANVPGDGISTTGGSGNSGSGGDGSFTIDPADIGNAFGAGSGSGSGDSAGSVGSDRPKRKYTRRNATPKGQTLSIDALSAIIMTGHSMLAGITKVAELELTADESANLASALSTVNAFYQVQVAEKTLAWVNLAMVSGMIYGTRIIAIRERRAQMRTAKVAQATAPKPAPAEPKVEEMITTGSMGVPDDFMPTPGFGSAPFQVN